MKIVICGDVHGCDYWKVGAEYLRNNPEAKMIFLGDYLDPYTGWEGVTSEEALVNFKELLEFANENEDRVILLYGNHDLFYVDEEKGQFVDDTPVDSINDCAVDTDNANEIVIGNSKIIPR